MHVTRGKRRRRREGEKEEKRRGEREKRENFLSLIQSWYSDRI